MVLIPWAKPEVVLARSLPLWRIWLHTRGWARCSASPRAAHRLQQRSSSLVFLVVHLLQNQPMAASRFARAAERDMPARRAANARGRLTAPFSFLCLAERPGYFGWTAPMTVLASRHRCISIVDFGPEGW